MARLAMQLTPMKAAWWEADVVASPAVVACVVLVPPLPAPLVVVLVVVVVVVVVVVGKPLY